MNELACACAPGGSVRCRVPCNKALEKDSRTVIQPCICFKEEPSQFSTGQTSQSLTCSIMEKPQTGLDECPRILLSCFRARNSGQMHIIQDDRRSSHPNPSCEKSAVVKLNLTSSLFMWPHYNIRRYSTQLKGED